MKMACFCIFANIEDDNDRECCQPIYPFTDDIITENCQVNQNCDSNKLFFNNKLRFYL